MATVPVLVLLGDSNMSGFASLADVPTADFSRWTGTTWPTTTWAVDMTQPKDVSIDDVVMLSTNMPFNSSDRRNITAVPTTTTITLDGAALVTAQEDTFVYISKNSTGYGQTLRIDADPNGLNTITVLDPLTGGAPTLPVAADGFIELLTNTHTIASSTGDTDLDQTTITKTALTADFTVTEGDWIVLLTTTRDARRVVSATATTVTVTPRITNAIPAGYGIREMLGANSVRSLSELTSTRCALRNLRFYHDVAGSYSNPGDYPTSLTLERQSPFQHYSDNRFNCLPEATWWLKGHYGQKIYAVIEGVGGATAVTQQVTEATWLVGTYYSYRPDITHNDFDPGVSTGLYAALTAKLTAMKALITAAGDTMQVVAFLSNVGTNDAAWEERADQYEVAMGNVIDSLRAYVVAQSMTTLAAERIPFALTTVNTTLAIRPYKATVNTAMTNLAAAKPSVFVIDATDFGLGADSLHLNAAGQIAWGKGFYDGLVPFLDDHTPLTVETGTGSSTANSYCTLDFADDFLRERHGNPTAWSGASIATRQDALRQATLALDLRYGLAWSGERYTSEQALDWPRSNAVDSAGNYISSSTIPERLKQATALLALLYVQGNTIMPTTEASADIASESKSVGSISKSVVYRGSKPSQTRFPMVDKVLGSAGLIAYAGIGWGTART